MRVPKRLLLLGLTLACCYGFAFAQKMSIEGRGMSISAVLKSIRDQTGISLNYLNDIFRDAPHVDLDLHHVEVREVLDSCLAGLRFDYVFRGGAITISRRPGVGVYLPLIGRVQSVVGEALPGVTI